MKKTPGKQEFRKWRNPVRGKTNPQVMDNPFWIWCVRNDQNAFQINRKFGGPDPFKSGPCWCFQRFGQARVQLPDGRAVLIAGEHEDSYDPDFYIYNDVVVMDDSKIQIFGYPESEFPPTDFHSATLTESGVILIGNLGYAEARREGYAQVCRLDLTDWTISALTTEGESPGWIHNHTAALLPGGDAIVISGGKRCGKRISENLDDYRLCLKTLTWKRLTRKNWKRWILNREDGKTNDLWRIRNDAWKSKLPPSLQQRLKEALPDEFEHLVARLLPKTTPSQIDQIDRLYHFLYRESSAMDVGDSHSRRQLLVGDTIVRIDEDMHDLTVTVEGNLANGVMGEILNRLRDRLSELESTKYIISELEE